MPEGKALAAEETGNVSLVKAIDLLLDSKRLQDGQSSFLQASFTSYLRNFQRASGSASAPFPSARRFRPASRPL
jgi:uncharacterized membrane protein